MSSVSSSSLIPPRFFQLDSLTLQTGLEERFRDLLHGAVDPIVPSTWLEDFRLLVDITVSASCFALGILSSRFDQNAGFSVGYGDNVYNMRYVMNEEGINYNNNLHRGGRSSHHHHGTLLFRLCARWVMLSVLPLLSRLVQRRWLNANNNNNINQQIQQIQQQHEQQEEGQVQNNINLNNDNNNVNNAPATRTTNVSAQAAEVIRHSERIFRAMELLNHVHFLYAGRFRGIVDRLLGLRLASGDNELLLSAHTYLIDRQHWWTTVFAAMSLFVPMLRIGSWVQFFARTIRRWFSNSNATTSSTNNANDLIGNTNANNNNNNGNSTRQTSSSTTTTMNDPNDQLFECLVCHSNPMAMPRRARECGHVCICYYCAATSKLEACPLCHAECSAFEVL